MSFLTLTIKLHIFNSPNLFKYKKMVLHSFVIKYVICCSCCFRSLPHHFWKNPTCNDTLDTLDHAFLGRNWKSLRNGAALTHHCDAIGLQRQPSEDAESLNERQLLSMSRCESAFIVVQLTPFSWAWTFGNAAVREHVLCQHVYMESHNRVNKQIRPQQDL